jgi:hypothetical protein
MTHSINQPWAITDKFRKKYGDTWADLDFVFNDKISAEVFKEDPMNTEIGHLEIFNQKIKLRYKDLISLSKSMNEKYSKVVSEKPAKDYAYNVDIKSYSFSLCKHEIGRLSDTVTDALNTSIRSYELGLYL